MDNSVILDNSNNFKYFGYINIRVFHILVIFFGNLKTKYNLYLSTYSVLTRFKFFSFRNIWTARLFVKFIQFQIYLFCRLRFGFFFLINMPRHSWNHSDTACFFCTFLLYSFVAHVKWWHMFFYSTFLAIWFINNILIFLIL